jgi:DNA (cytosine-5)-methyltransferase 1
MTRSGRSRAVLDTPNRVGLRVASLFSGIGGFELGLASAAHKVHLFCELDPAARAVLRQRFPGTRLISDVATMESLPSKTELVCAGFPCQNLSMAGDKQGIKGPKSNLVDQVFRLLDVRLVPWVLFENVYFMLHLDKGHAMEHVIGNLERRGMRWAYRVLNTLGFGLPQRRRRVYLIASQELDPRDVLLSDDGPGLNEPTPPDLSLPVGFYWTEGRSGIGLTSDGIPPLKTGSALGIPSAPAVLFPDGSVETPTIEEAERLQGFPSGWTVAAETINGRLRWRLLGNAVSVPIAEWIGRRLADPRPYDSSADERLRKGDRWPTAAWGDGTSRFRSDVSECPLGVRASLNSFASRPWSPLSQKALRGFLSRAESSQLRFPVGFLDALHCYLSKVVDSR